MTWRALSSSALWFSPLPWAVLCWSWSACSVAYGLTEAEQRGRVGLVSAIRS